MRHRQFRPARFLALLLLPLICGCGGSGDDPNHFQVSGNVNWKGAPVPVGFITFEPDASKGTTGPAGGAKITDGSYQTTPGRGIVGGDYIVRIRGYDGVKANSSDDMPDERGARLFPEKTLKVEFPADDTTQDFHLPVEAG